MYFPSKKALTLAFACSLILSGCETPAQGMKSKASPVSLHRSDEIGAVAATVNDADKISKLEEEVASLKREMAAARPKIAKIDVMEQKFKDLSLGLDRIDATYNMKPTTQVAPVPAHQAAPQPMPVAEAMPVPAPVSPTPVTGKPETLTPVPEEKKTQPPVAVAPPPPAPKIDKAPEAPTPPAAKGEKVVKDLRIGEQKGSSRLVLDLGEVTPVNYDIDNEEKILLIDIPGFKWNGPKSKNFEKSPLIASYQADNDEKGARLVVQLKSAAKVANYSTIKATGGKSPRAVLDISPQ